MSGERRGRDRETKVCGWLSDEGWLCGSRRHIPGPGDVLAVHPIPGTKYGSLLEAWLIEVKSTAGGPWERFGPVDRRALREAAHAAGARPVVVWWPPRKLPQTIHEEEWPK